MKMWRQMGDSDSAQCLGSFGCQNPICRASITTVGLSPHPALKAQLLLLKLSPKACKCVAWECFPSSLCVSAVRLWAAEREQRGASPTSSCSSCQRGRAQTQPLPFRLHSAAWHSWASHHVAAHVGASARHVRCHIVSHIGRQRELKKLNGRETPPPPPQIQPIFFPLLLFLISGTMRQSKAWGEERG